MENSEILGFQFELIKVLQSDSSLGEGLEICSSSDSEPSTFRQNKASVDTWCHHVFQTPATKKCLCYDELNTCKYFKIRRLYIYLLTTLQIFSIKLINEHASINLILIRNTKRQKVFFRVLFCFLRLYLVSRFLYFMIHTSLFETNL